AAADVENGKPAQAVQRFRVAAIVRADAVADESDAHGVELVQGRHLAARAPPVACERGKARDFGLVDGGAAFVGISHFRASHGLRRCGLGGAIVSMRAFSPAKLRSTPL